MNLQQRALCLFALISCVLIVVLIARTPQSVYSDPSEQLRALQDYLSGKSPSLNQFIMPQPKDVSRDTLGWIYWWPPGPQIIAYPFMAGGLGIGDTLRIIAIICLVAGSLGWVKWFSLFSLPLWMKIVFAFGIPWLRYAHSPLFIFSAECFAYSLVPWLLFAAYKFNEALTRDKIRPAGIIVSAMGLGLSLGLAYVLKYSIVLVSLGILVYLGIIAYRILKDKGSNLRGFVAAGFVLALIFFAIPVAVMNLLNYKFSQNMNFVSARMGLDLKIDKLFYLLANPGLSIMDLDSMLRYIVLHPAHGMWIKYPWLGNGMRGHYIFLVLVGIPGSLTILWLILRRRINTGPRTLAYSVFFTNFSALLCLFCVSRISYESRHFIVASITVLPVVLQEGLALWAHSRLRIVRWILAGMAFAYLVMPLLYGDMAAVFKAIRAPKDYVFGPSRIYNPRLSDTDIMAVRKQLLRNFDIAKDVWYFPDPISALDIPGRKIVWDADFSDIEELKRFSFVTSVPLRVFVLLPPYFEQNGKGLVIRGFFPQAGEWKSYFVRECKYVLWMTTLNVH